MLAAYGVKVHHFPVRKKRPYRQMKLLLLRHLPTVKEAVAVTASAVVAAVALAVAMSVVVVAAAAAVAVEKKTDCRLKERGKLGKA